jgi:hypothetical protein
LYRSPLDNEISLLSKSAGRLLLPQSQPCADGCRIRYQRCYQTLGDLLPMHRKRIVGLEKMLCYAFGRPPGHAAIAPRDLPVAEIRSRLGKSG